MAWPQSVEAVSRPIESPVPVPRRGDTIDLDRGVRRYEETPPVLERVLDGWRRLRSHGRAVELARLRLELEGVRGLLQRELDAVRAERDALRVLLTTAEAARERAAQEREQALVDAAKLRFQAESDRARVEQLERAEAELRSEIEGLRAGPVEGDILAPSTRPSWWARLTR